MNAKYRNPKLKGRGLNRRYLHEIYYYGNPMEYRPPLTRVPGRAVIGGGGIFLEPLNILSSQLNFTLNLTASIDDKWGSVNEKGVWNGMIGNELTSQSLLESRVTKHASSWRYR